ncbi:futalosine hydrolase [Streptomyces sp. SID8358]|uniref:futalosine hydrolase n=1 Tax=unclassified Streptomyces TaxID=2593676 RepID=UPI00081B073A|nr:futalosine hydrolase [Streptomyces sp. BpilaLS-43]MYU36349.1 futalosine hydrolase [Streptomyces sp. SID8358]SCD27803.1 futalosine hydrolase [Streptomyces sp. BpilaLS-43]
MRVLVVTAVPAERDAVTRAVGRPPEIRAVPGAEVHRAGPFDVVAGGAGPAASAAATAFALAAARTPDTGAADSSTSRLGGPGSEPPGSGSPGLRSPALRSPDSRSPDDAPYGLVVSAGIGGGFAPAAPVGSLVVASAIVAADLGAETPDGFVPVTGLGFGRDLFVPPAALVREVAEATGAVRGRVLTVSTVTGSAARTAALLAAHPGAVAEAMEGFGVAEAADRLGVPVLELRAVSNAVGPRDRDAWRIGEALAALTEAFGKIAPVVEGWTHDRLDRLRAPHRD